MTTPLLDPDAVQVGTANGPGLWLAPERTAAPTDTFTPWADPWESLGYASDDGPTVSQNTDSQDLTPWQSRSPIRSVVTSRTVSIQFILWELRGDTLALYFDTDVPTTDPTTGAVSMEVRSDGQAHLYAIGIDTRDGDRCMRIVFPRASLTDNGDMQIQRGDVVPLDCTLTAQDDSGVLAYVLLGPAEDPAGVGGAGAQVETKVLTTPAAVADTLAGAGARRQADVP